jgi:hypothetical protein
MFSYRINRAKTQELVAKAGATLDQLKRNGEVQLEAGLKVTLTGRCTYTVVDLHTDTGETLADLVPEHDRHLVPAWDVDGDGRTRTQRLADEKDAAATKAVLHALLKD